MLDENELLERESVEWRASKFNDAWLTWENSTL
jgi:hypothetical protein